jgi:hypothetical protein
MYDVMTFCDETDYFAFEKEGYGRAKRALERFLSGYEEHRGRPRGRSGARFSI